MLNYLRATGKDVGLVLNFGREAEIKRKVNSRGDLRVGNADFADKMDCAEVGNAD